jgi:4'-phosphopantetheinyl transferase
MVHEPWTPGPLVPALGRGDVHVWRAPLGHPPARLASFSATLAPEERAQASRFPFSVHRDRFVAGRGIQREILGRYLGTPPAGLSFRAASHGKPLLNPAPAAFDLRFNVSNSGDVALYALSVGRELGVDMEAHRPMPEALAIAERFFSAPENAVFGALDAREQELAFFRCWTRKEAFVKAVGEGLSIPLDCFDVAFAPGEEARILDIRDDRAHVGRWSMRAIEPGDRYVGALVVEGTGWTLSCYDWAPPEEAAGGALTG